MDQNIKIGDLLLYGKIHAKETNTFGVVVEINHKNTMAKCYWVSVGYHTFEFTEKAGEYKKNVERFLKD